jgi:hypothetical protein
MDFPGPKRRYTEFNSTRKGDISESVIISRLLACGYEILRPVGNSSRYDLVIEDADGKFWRVQCKTGRLFERGNSIAFATSSRHYHLRAKEGASRSKTYYGQAEYFAVYCPDTRGVYLVPVDHAGASQMNLRLVPTKNNQERNVRWAKDYEI